jgi:small basic protein
LLVRTFQLPKSASLGAVLGAFDAREDRAMKDAIFIVGAMIFFAVSILYVYGCERLK